ncbi:MAG TPA: assimilatory sulfite reductase (NADPH) hemoprotein subunit [Burkholderiales bacterium]|nr:assimilatory sulfite reductase (NADPH) hemoprotein subunit [Burkholderiales bacterium]
MDQPTHDTRSEVEHIKEASNYLRGTLVEGLGNPITGAISEKDAQLIKFHGSYLQDDRDLRIERQKQKLEPAYQFMVRVRFPGGVCTSQQWLALSDIAQRHAGNTIRLTTRQSVQLHGILKRELKEAIAGINSALLTTIAACGDVNRNVMCSPNPLQSRVHRQIYDYCLRAARHLTPHTRAYHEIWLGDELVAGGAPKEEDREPIYGKTYLPRKFKIAIAVPPVNDVDVFGNDLGFIGIVDGEQVVGFNVAIGGGMGMIHGDPGSYPRLADVIGYCAADRMVEVSEAVAKVQRDHGNRSNRKHARLKYTIDDHGLDWFKGEIERYLGWKFEAARPYHFDTNGDRYGWSEGADGNWHLTLFIQNGRIADRADSSPMSGLREIASIHQGEFRFTPNQNLIISGVTPERKPAIETLVQKHGLDGGDHRSALRLHSMACVALPTCGLALAESERYLPSLLVKLERLLQDAGLTDVPITIRMTGCPNGCARPYIAEIGLVGKSLGKYNLYLGAGFAGERMNKLYRESLDEAEILSELEPIIRRYASERDSGEHFGDFVVRKGYVKPAAQGRDFHA